MDTEKSWCVEVLDTPRDGSCFFTSIAMAMNDSIEMWYSIDELRTPMENYWGLYRDDTEENLCEVTADLVRFMCALNVDDTILELYNVEAEYRRETEKSGAQTFNTKKQLGDHMRNRNTWGDHAALHAFLRSLDFNCGVIVFDAEIGGMSYLPLEWTKNKKAYICLRRENNHYGVIRLKRDSSENELLCVTRETMLDLVKNINSVVHSDKTLGEESF